LWGAVAAVSLSAIVWPEHQIGAAVFLGIAAMGTISIAWQSYRYRTEG
jgi:hypothetical protein